VFYSAPGVTVEGHSPAVWRPCRVREARDSLQSVAGNNVTRRSAHKNSVTAAGGSGGGVTVIERDSEVG